ncbi:MAG: pyridoxal phosphate-dependent aminotransferase [Acidobacteriota bacterium]|jgi:aspartate aminotransferase
MPKTALSNRAQKTPPSPIRKLAHLAIQAKKAGTHVYKLNIGQPDIESPREYFEGLRFFEEKVIAYEESQGNERLCEAWSKYINRTLNVETQPEQFLITVGASEALVFAFMTCCDPGDEIIIFDPTYANYLGFAAIAGISLVPVLSNMENNFALPDRSAIADKISDRTRAILICSPNNPTGTVCSREELTLLHDLCEEHNLFLLCDETYREFVYDDFEPFSILNIVPKSERAIVMDSLSKRFSLCGARIGCLITSNEEFNAAALKIAQARLAAPTMSQFAAAHMLENIGDDFLSRVTGEFRGRRDALYAALKSIPGVVAHKPQGAFYTVVHLPVEDADDFAAYLLDQFSYEGKTTFVAPASGFYMQTSKGRQQVRIAYVLNKQDIREAITVLAAGLESYDKK